MKGFFHDHVLPRRQRGFAIFVMRIVGRVHNDQLQFGIVEQRLHVRVNLYVRVTLLRKVFAAFHHRGKLKSRVHVDERRMKSIAAMAVGT